jgi:hypothetical protein
VLVSPWGDDSIPLPDIKHDNEEARAIWISTDGCVRETRDRTTQISVPIATAVTDRRLLFLTQGERRGEPEEVYPVAYSEIAAVDTDGQRLLVTTTESVVWRMPFPDSSRMDPILRHLRWIGHLRGHILSIRNDTELAAGEITDDADSLDWEQANSTYEQARQRLDETIVAVQLVDPVATHHLAPELTDIERTLEQAHARLCIERAKSALSLASHLIENEEHDRARAKLREAQGYYDRARGQSDAVKRGDAFEFGPQRELQEELESLRWEIGTVVAEPIRQAHEAKIQARSATEPREKLDHWERAFSRYGHVLAFDWQKADGNVAGDPAEVRADRETAAERIVELREELARETWDTGATHQREGRVTAALEHCLDAVEHLERVSELTGTVELAGERKIEDRLEQMRSVVAQLREAPVESDTEPDDGETATEESETASDESTGGTDDSFRDDEIPSVSELADIDTHHEITLDLTDPTATVGQETSEDATAGDEREADDESPQTTEQAGNSNP